MNIILTNHVVQMSRAEAAAKLRRARSRSKRAIKRIPGGWSLTDCDTTLIPNRFRHLGVISVMK